MKKGLGPASETLIQQGLDMTWAHVIITYLPGGSNGQLWLETTQLAHSPWKEGILASRADRQHGDWSRSLPSGSWGSLQHGSPGSVCWLRVPLSRGGGPVCVLGQLVTCTRTVLCVLYSPLCHFSFLAQQITWRGKVNLQLGACQFSLHIPQFLLEK